MNIVITGAAGRMAGILIKKALADDHHVVGLVRDKTKMHMTQDRLTVLEGEMTDARVLEQALRGADVVIEGVAAYPEGTQQVVASMEKLGIKRLVAVSTYSAPDSQDRFDLRYKIIVGILRIIIPKGVKGVRRAANIIRQSHLDWTLVRVLGLTDKPEKGHLRYGYLGRGDIGSSITRADMAQALLDQVTSEAYIRQAPAVSN